jgi:hypothetical protein
MSNLAVFQPAEAFKQEVAFQPGEIFWRAVGFRLAAAFTLVG